MDRRSVRLRLLVAAGLTVAAALLGAGWGLEVLFQRHLERRAAEELKIDLRVLLAGMRIDSAGGLILARTPARQRYSQAFSGVYWQVSRAGSVVERSRSLWDEKLALPTDVLPADGYHQHTISGLRGSTLLAVEQAVTVSRPSGTFVFRAAVAVDAREISQAAKAFRSDLVLGLSVLGIALLLAFWFALGIGLAPLRRMKNALGLLRSGKESRLVGHYPSEVEPLVDGLNDLLCRQEDLVQRARARAGNLAHGLKTPLTAISVLAEELTEREEHDAARELLNHVSSMQRHVEHELALTRSAHGQVGQELIVLGEFVARLVRTMQRLPRGSDLDWSIEIDRSIMVRIDEITLGEVVGNILDNARKWARRKIRVTAASTVEWVDVTFSDDGPGVPPVEREMIVGRGKRLDETQPGSGLGLSIVSDIIQQIGGRFELTRSNSGGLEVRIRLRSGLHDDTG